MVKCEGGGLRMRWRIRWCGMVWRLMEIGGLVVERYERISARVEMSETT